MHKSKDMKTSIEEQSRIEHISLQAQDLKFRPIFAGSACPTHRLRNFIDILLKDTCEKVPSYTRDSMDFLIKIPETSDPYTLIVSFDVTSL